eukprot:gene39553-48153_t
MYWVVGLVQRSVRAAEQPVAFHPALRHLLPRCFVLSSRKCLFLPSLLPKLFAHIYSLLPDSDELRIFRDGMSIVCREPPESHAHANAEANIDAEANTNAGPDANAGDGQQEAQQQQEQKEQEQEEQGDIYTQVVVYPHYADADADAPSNREAATQQQDGFFLVVGSSRPARCVALLQKLRRFLGCEIWNLALDEHVLLQHPAAALAGGAVSTMAVEEAEDLFFCPSSSSSSTAPATLRRGLFGFALREDDEVAGEVEGEVLSLSVHRTRPLPLLPPYSTFSTAIEQVSRGLLLSPAQAADAAQLKRLLLQRMRAIGVTLTGGEDAAAGEDEEDEGLSLSAASLGDMVSQVAERGEELRQGEAAATLAKRDPSDLPLLPLLTCHAPAQADSGICEYRLHFLCPVCGAKAPSGRDGVGYPLHLLPGHLSAPLLAALGTTPVPRVPEATLDQVPQAFAASAQSYRLWSTLPVEDRAAVLRRAADALQAAMPQFCALLVKEAFKTWGDAVSEVREAVDFLRYYADEAQRIMQPIACPVVAHAQAGHQYGVTGETNTLRLTARGVWVCISPWNFPLAIFMGQVAAALATGNTVLAKPAEQTPLIAAQAVRILLQAGIPEGAVTVGAALVADERVKGVMFTGSTEVAGILARNVAGRLDSQGRPIPLIAETGGQNAMIVDSSALVEQVVTDVVASAFDSAGQRHYVGHVRDTTVRKKAEDDLRQLHDRLQCIGDNLPDGYIFQ